MSSEKKYNKPQPRRGPMNAKPVNHPNNRMNRKAFRKVKQRRAPQKVRRFNAPSARGYLERNTSPKTYRVTRSEPIGGILGSVAYVNTVFTCIPSNATAFPWLSGMANLYEKWRPVKLALRFESSAPTVTTGDLAIAFDYDAVDSTGFTDMTKLLTYAGSACGTTWESRVERFDPKRANRTTPWLFTSAGTDSRLNTAGYFNVATQGQANTNALGRLWMDYVIDFSTPKSSTTLVAATGDVGYIPCQAVSTGTRPNNVDIMGSQLGVSTNGSARIFDVENTSPGNGALFFGPSATSTYLENMYQFNDAQDARDRYQLYFPPGSYWLATFMWTSTSAVTLDGALDAAVGFASPVDNYNVAASYLESTTCQTYGGSGAYFMGTQTVLIRAPVSGRYNVCVVDISPGLPNITYRALLISVIQTRFTYFGMITAPTVPAQVITTTKPDPCGRPVPKLKKEEQKSEEKPSSKTKDWVELPLKSEFYFDDKTTKCSAPPRSSSLTRNTPTSSNSRVPT